MASLIGSLLAGPSSWFGGPNDKTTGPTTASGAPTSTPGIAVNNRATLGGWWLLKAPNGDIGLVKQTDLGPSPSTGRKFDYTYSLLSLFGYSQQNFPTGSQTNGYYLGQNFATFGGALTTALGKLGATPGQSAAIQSSIDSGTITHGGSAVVAPIGQKPGTTITSAGQIPITSEAVSAGINLPNPLSGIDAIAALLTNTQFWLRLGEGIAAVLLIYLGLHALTGQSSSAGQQVKHVTRIVPVPL
jgi:hypothetical protein